MFVVRNYFPVIVTGAGVAVPAKAPPVKAPVKAEAAAKPRAPATNGPKTIFFFYLKGL